MISKPIFTSLSPNAEADDIKASLSIIFKPFCWKKTKKAKELEEKFKNRFRTEYVFSVNSGRSGLILILKAIGIGEGDEVLLQGFTCNAAVNPVLRLGAVPVFVDIDETLNLDPKDLERKITGKSRAVIVQHTFGWPAQIEEIKKVAEEKGLFLIEDCAHSLGASYKGEFCGSFGDAAFFSFGRDKTISSVFGGMVTVRKQGLAEKMRKEWENLKLPSSFWIFQQLLHPFLCWFFVIPAYALNQHLGRLVLGAFHRLSILSKSVYKKEKRGKIPCHFPTRMPDALASLALRQFSKLERFNRHRKEVARLYERELEGFKAPFAASERDRQPSYLKYPVLVGVDTDEFLKRARKRKIYLDDGWRKSPVVPPDTDLESMKYVKGSCPEAEKAALKIVNLPCHIGINQKEARKVVSLLKSYAKR
jgi:dTDP-4-amino-4,6-dideoxygalactose transaminase